MKRVMYLMLDHFRMWFTMLLMLATMAGAVFAQYLERWL